MNHAERESIAALDRVNNLGRYRLIADLARGGMGIVYLALVHGPGGFNKLFVVKELKTHLAEDPNLVRMFLEEARLAAKLNHPNVVQTMEVGSDGDRHFIAMEYLDGQSLYRALARTRKAAEPFPLRYSLFILSHMLEGLQYAHSALDFHGSRMNLVHRDVSPHNVFITYDGQVKVLDFGIAKALDSSNDTRTGVLKGKVAYMAPEQAAGQAIDRRADVFSAGVMLFEAATGTRFWSGVPNDLQILHALANGFVARPRTVKVDVDPRVERIILKATAVKREERYASAAEMQADLEGYMKQLAGPFFGARDVGKFFSGLFATERAHMKQVIDDQLRTQRGKISGEYGKVDAARPTSSSFPTATPSHLVLKSLVATPEEIPSSSNQEPTRYHGMYRPALGEAPSATVNSSGKAKTRFSRAAVLVAVGAAMASVAFVALQRASIPTPGPMISASPVLETAVVPAPTPPLSPRTNEIRVLVTASPIVATITIDDRTPQNGTFRGTLPRDSATHTIRIEAQKYEPKTLLFQADEDHSFDFSLDPIKEAIAPPVAHVHLGAPPSQSPSAPPLAAPAPPPPPLQPTSHVRQQIDTRDPYAQ